VCVAIRCARDALWPGGMMGPPRVVPTPVEAARIRSNAESAILDLLPRMTSRGRGANVAGSLRTAVLGTDPQQQRENVHELCDLFARKECNKHLLFYLLDLVVVRVIPELGETTPKELSDLRA
jgi:hypothetical protein